MEITLRSGKTKKATSVLARGAAPPLRRNEGCEAQPASAFSSPSLPFPFHTMNARRLTGHTFPSTFSRMWNIQHNSKWKTKVERCGRKNELPCTLTSYSMLRMNFTQVEIWKIRLKSMSEYVLAALVKCPLTPSAPVVRPPPAVVSYLNPYFQHQEAKTSVYEYDSSYLESHLLFHTMQS